MHNIIPLIFIGLVVYLVFFRKGGMGCCGGHGTHEPEKHHGHHAGGSSHDPEGKVVDLREDEYRIRRR